MADFNVTDAKRLCNLRVATAKSAKNLPEVDFLRREFYGKLRSSLEDVCSQFGNIHQLKGREA